MIRDSAAEINNIYKKCQQQNQCHWIYEIFNLPTWEKSNGFGFMILTKLWIPSWLPFSLERGDIQIRQGFNRWLIILIIDNDGLFHSDDFFVSDFLRLDCVTRFFLKLFEIIFLLEPLPINMEFMFRRDFSLDLMFHYTLEIKMFGIRPEFQKNWTNLCFHEKFP